MKTILENLRNDLINNIDEKSRESTPRFFKEEVKFYGLRSAVVQEIGKSHFKQIKSWPKETIFDLCEKLWQSQFLEETFIACAWSYNLHKQYVPADIQVFERWISQYVTNWASCDTFCNHTVGTFIEMYPDHIQNLKDYARSGNRWMRRAAAVSLIIPARKGKFLPDILEIADILLLDQDDLVQKGYGWMLKAASQAHQQEIFNYVVRNKATMPRTALRYAIEKMPAGLKKIAMER